MAHKHQYLTYYIHLTDLAVVTALQATGSTETRGAVLSAPDGIAIERSAPIKLSTQPFVAPCLTSDWFGTPDHFPTNVDAFDRKSGGWFGVPWLFGDTTTYHWRGIWTYSAPATVPGVPVPVNIAPLRWIDGFEIVDPASGNAGPENGKQTNPNNDNSHNFRHASRHVDGCGWAWRQNTSIRTHDITEHGGSSASTFASWERFYIRLLRAPAVQTRLWTARSTGGIDAYAIEIMPSGQIAFGWDSNVGTFTVVGTTAALALNVWKKIDVRFWFGPVGVGGNQFELWINGVNAIAGTINAQGASGPAGNLPAAWSSVTAYVIGNQVGIGGHAYQANANNTNVQPPAAQWTLIDSTFFNRHGSSRIGNAIANTMEIDIDDWICGDHMGTGDGVDFQNGTRVKLLRATGLDAATSGFTGDYRWANLPTPLDALPASDLASSTNAAVLALTMNAADVDALPESLGAVAILTQLWQTGATNPGTNQAVCGAAALTTAVVAQSVTAADWKRAFKSLSGTPTAIKPITSIILKHIKGSAAAETIRGFSCTVAIIGSFGPEDLGPLAPSPKVLPANTGPHNAPYPRTPWARQTVAPIQPVFIRSGTYVGNGTGQDLLFPSPINFFRARPSTVAVAGGTLWWSSMIASHVGENVGLDGTGMVQALMDEAFVPLTTETNSQVIDRELWNAKMKTEGRPPTPADRLYWQATISADAGAIVAGVMIDFWIQKLLGQGSTGVDIPTHGPYAVPPSALLPLPAGVSFVGDGNPQQSCILRIVGNAAQSNAAGVTYSYIAIGDPGQRFMTNGALRDLTTPNLVDVVSPLYKADWLPEAAFIQPENAGGVSVGGYFKGVGSSAASIATMFPTGETANAMTFGAGNITTKAALVALALGNCPAFSAWRTSDGSSDDVGPNRGKVVQIISYIGDGAGSRTVALLPGVGKRPVWAVVVPRNAGATYYRDAAHATLNASRWDTGGLVNTAIVGGGIDSISVGPTLNTNAVVYDVLAIPGDSTAGNDGWSIGGDFWPVPPDPPPGALGQEDGGGPTPGSAPSAATPSPVVLPDPLAPTGPMPTLTDDLDVLCEPATRTIINTALSRIGVSKQIVNVATEQSIEASSMRLVYNDAIQEVLRDVPWPFATRLVQLAQVGATRPNSDWLYAYRQPSDCIFERRIVISRTDVANPDPIAFQLSSDDTGGLIFTNQANAVLEYTARPKCPHTRGEVLFKEAAIWKLAGACAAALTRMPEKVAECQKEYDNAIGRFYVVLRPGNPGEMPGTATVDTTAVAKAANVTAVNLALISIGAPTIVNLATDQTRSAQVARMIFEQELRACLRDFPWPFATAYVTPTLVAGTSTVGVNGDWQYSYRVPADLVFARRLVGQARRGYEANPQPFKLANDATGGLLYTDQANTTANPVILEYTARIEAAVSRADALFVDALAWRLAWKFAPSLAQIVPERPEAMGRGADEAAVRDKVQPATGNSLRKKAADTARECYYFAIATARMTSANESEPDITPPDADWIRGR